MFNEEILRLRSSQERMSDSDIVKREERMRLENYEKIRAIQDGTRYEILNAIRRLEMLREEDEKDPGATKVRIATATGFSIPTVTRAIEQLTADIIIDAEKQEKISDGAVAAPDNPNKYVINPQYGYFVGIHLGIQRIRISICDFAMKPLQSDELHKLFSDYETVMPKEYKGRFEVQDAYCTFQTSRMKDRSASSTEMSGANGIDGSEPQKKESDYSANKPQALSFNRLQEFVSFVVQFLYDCFVAAEKNLLSICIATPAVCDFQSMEVKHCAGLSGLKDANLTELLDSETSAVLEQQCILCGFEHNTEAVLMYEREQLYKKEKSNKSNKEECHFDNIATVYLGSDIGVAFIVNGSLYRGRLGTSGELGALYAPDLPGFRETDELLEQLKAESFEEDIEVDNEGNKKIKIHNFSDVTADLENTLKQNYLTLEAAIRYRVFNVLPSHYEAFLRRIHNVKMLKQMKTQKKTRFNLLVQYISYISNVLINLLSMDIIIYGGVICSAVDGLISEVARIKYGAALHCLAKETFITGTLDKKRGDDIVSIGAAHAALMQCDEKNHKEKTLDADDDGSVADKKNKKKTYFVELPLKVSWKKLGVGDNE